WTTYTTSQLWVSYRRGPLGGRGRKPRPGDRIGDLACERPDGNRTRLNAELRGKWAVLGDQATFEAARQRLGDQVVSLRAVGHADGPAMLVRPDAHLACKGGPAEFARWLEGALR
ncbi:oxygenase, partial [Nonomuraea sp. NPDC051941]